jgi:hypothetical protein
MPANHPTDLRDRVFEFVCAIVLFCRELSKEPGVDRQIAWQLAAAATSVGSNLEEAKLTAGMKRLHPVGLRVLAPLAAVLLLLPVLKFLVLSSEF